MGLIRRDQAERAGARPSSISFTDAAAAGKKLSDTTAGGKRNYQEEEIQYSRVEFQVQDAAH